ncbi:hypothetical protein F4779DRAFT_612227 [Xylariaceae sp. FL0662B]|nr:hypothetical protein F4779DRAFT_612227 [Xylariaceae sp. FL0662B]
MASTQSSQTPHFWDGEYAPPAAQSLLSDEIAPMNILNCRRWVQMWQKPLGVVGSGSELEWKQQLWCNVLQTLGLEGMELVTVMEENGPSEEWRQCLQDIKTKVENVDDGMKPEKHRMATRTHIFMSYY